MAHGTGKTELAIRRETSRTTYETSRDFLTLGRDNFKPTFGSEYNQSWNNTGLIGSLKIPRNQEEVMSVLLAYKKHHDRYPGAGSLVITHILLSSLVDAEKKTG